MTETFTLFFYGTLRAAEVRRAVLGTDIPACLLSPARLNDFAVRRVDGALYPMLVHNVGGRATGLVATGLSGDVVATDRLKGGITPASSFNWTQLQGRSWQRCIFLTRK